jgi:hypothetical protein
MTNPTEFFFTFRDFIALLRKITLHIPVKTIIGELLLCAVAALLFFVFNLALEPIIFGLIFLGVLYWNWEGRFVMGLAVVCLISIIVMQLVSYLLPIIPARHWGTQIATWSFYLLIIGVAKQIIELIWESLHDRKDSSSQYHS